MIPSEFSPVHIMELEWVLLTYFQDVKNDARFSNLEGIAGLGKRMVKIRKYLILHLVYLLIKLFMLLSVAMLLPVATA